MKTKNFSRYLIVTVISTLLISCTNPASDDEHDEHTIPVGMKMVMNGEVILTYFDEQVTGQLQVDEGDETPLITVYFLNEEEERIHDEDLGTEYSLDWNIENTDIIDVEQRDEDGRWSFHLVGKSAGVTNIQFILMHGSHDDLVTPGLEQEEAIQAEVVSPQG